MTINITYTLSFRRVIPRVAYRDKAGRRRMKQVFYDGGLGRQIYNEVSG